MKLLLYSAVLVLLLAAVAGASDYSCPANDPNLQNEYKSCTLIRPLYYDEQGKAYSYTDDKILINCSKTVKSTHDVVPLGGLYVNVIGYDEDVNAVQQKKGYTNSDGIFTFTPLVAGDYLIDVQGFEAPSTCEVRDNPDSIQARAEGTPTGGAVADSGALETEDSAAEVNETDTVIDEPEVQTAGKDEKEESGLLGFVMNGTEQEEEKTKASSFVLMLLGFMIS